MQYDERQQYIMRFVPRLEFPFDGDCRQAIGIDLPIAVINLANRPDRWQALTSRMSAVGLDKLVKVPAVEGAKLSTGAITSLLQRPAGSVAGSPTSHLTLTPPAIGCFLSHLAVWRRIIEHNFPRVLVFEDDAAPAMNFDAGKFKDVIASLGDSGLTFVGQVIMDGLAEVPVAGATMARLYYFNGTFAYLITAAACRTLIRALNRPDRHIDHQISKVLIEQRTTFPAYHTVPHFFEADWTLQSDCYVPLSGVDGADRELGTLLSNNRRILLDEGRPLLPPFEPIDQQN